MSWHDLRFVGQVVPEHSAGCDRLGGARSRFIDTVRATAGVGAKVSRALRRRRRSAWTVTARRILARPK